MGLLQAVMAQIGWGRAGLVRLPVIPSPSCGGHGAVRWLHAGSIKRATSPMVRGHDKRRPRFGALFGDVSAVHDGVDSRWRGVSPAHEHRWRGR